MYEEFQTCLEDAEGTGGFASENDIRTCFIDAGYIQGTNDDSEDENDGEDSDEDTSN